MCKAHKFKDNGRAEREPWAVLRKIGHKRRLTRSNMRYMDGS